MLQHKLSARLASELGSRHMQDSTLITVRDLFRHPRPPMELLELAGDLFREQAGAFPGRRPEQQVAHVLYLVTVLVARVRYQGAVMRLGDPEQIRGLDWAVAQKWVDEHTGCLLHGGRALLCSDLKPEDSRKG